MYLYELGKETKLQITARAEMKTAEFETKVLEVKDQYLFAAPIMRDDKIVGFSSDDVSISVFAINQEDQKVYEFRNAVIRNIKAPDGNLYHIIACQSAGRAVNRREACRIWLGFDGVAQIGQEKKPYDVMVKDISATGISFVCGKNVKIETAMPVGITFMDETSKTKFNIGAVVVRKNEEDNQKTIYGCRMKQESMAISKYINDKQREKLHASRTVNAAMNQRSRERR